MSNIESKKLVELRIPRTKLVDALRHISNISVSSAIGLIVDREDENKILGLSFGNFVEIAPQSFVVVSYPVTTDEMVNLTSFMDDTEEWPAYFVASNEQFINSICTLPPVDDEDSLDLVLYNLKDGDAVKSETTVLGYHNSFAKSIMDTTGWEVKDNKVVYSSGKDTEANLLRLYT